MRPVALAPRPDAQGYDGGQTAAGILEQLPAGVAQLYADGEELRVLETNATMLALLPAWTTGGSLAGRSLADLLPGLRDLELPRLVRRIVEGGETVTFVDAEAGGRDASGGAARFFTGTLGPTTLPDGRDGATIVLVETTDAVRARRDVAATLRAESRRRSELETLLESITDGVSFHDQVGDLLYLNDAARAVLGGIGMSDRELVRMIRDSFVDLRGRPIRYREMPFIRALRESRVVRTEVVLRRGPTLTRGAANVRLNVVASPVLRHGEVTGAVVVFRDVTQDAERARRQLRAIADIALHLGDANDTAMILERALEASTELADAGRGLIYLQERGALVRAASTGCDAELARWFDRRTGEPGDLHHAVVAEGRLASVGNGGHDERVGARFPHSLARTLGGGVAVPIRAHGETVGVLSVWRERPGELEEGDVVLLQAVADQAGLALVNARLIAAASRARGALIQAQEQERRIIAADLHDGVMQEIAAAAVTLGAAQRFLDNGDVPQAAELYRRETTRINEAARALRGVLYDLRPQELDQHGLDHAIRSLARKLADEAGVEMDVRVELGGERPGPVLEVTLYRFVQEAFTNVRKHAHASRVELRLARDGADVVATVRDDGLGFALPSLADQLRGEAFGVRGMRERVEGAGGSFTIKSWPGDGTLVKARLRWTGAES